MRIISLQASNIKRLSVVEITPQGDVVTIGGKNRAGKSSVLDAIAYALGGQALVPEEPIRTGETEAEVKVDLGDLLVVRRFYREVIEDKESGTTRHGATKSTLSVKNKEGASYPSPQAMLDKLLGSLTFDPREFAMTKPKAQLETLRRITNLDTTLLDEQRRDVFNRRTELKKKVLEASVKCDALPALLPDVPLEELSMGEVSTELARVDSLRKKAESERLSLQVEQDTAQRSKNRLDAATERVKSLRAQLAEAEQVMGEINRDWHAQTEVVKSLEQKVDVALKAVPDTTTLQDRIKEIEATNAKVRQNKARLAAAKAHNDLVDKVKDETALIEEFDKRKQEMIAAVKFPVAGLGFGEEGVLFNGLPFEQAATSEQLAVSVAIGLALNPKLRILLVRNGESLDSESMKLLGELATFANAQLWVERMTETKDGVSVMIEDGHVQP